MAMQLNQVVPWGRSMSEYQRMFRLSEDDLRLKILGCGDGPASFNSEMTAAGYHVTSCDPIYAFDAAQIRQRVNETYPKIVEQVGNSQQDYVWTEFASPIDLAEKRMAAMELFLADYDAGKATGRYRMEELPALSFDDAAFDLALCSHLLFLYSEQLSQDFHLASIRELCRVAREVRIFPLLALDCHPSAYVAPLQAQLNADGYRCEIVPVNYEFQRGGNQMMRVRRV